MDALNWLRAVLVAFALAAAIILAADGNWIPAAVLGVGILAHFWLFAVLYRQRKRESDSPAGLLRP